MVEFESLSERLYRVVRQAAKETGKQVRWTSSAARSKSTAACWSA
jgi:chemotaxis protein histidine kinase CheA